MNSIEHNLAVVDRHIQGEARDVDSILDLYTDDIVMEVPGRNLRLEGRATIRANYLAMWPSMAEVELIPLDRFATEDRVVDDMLVRMRLVGPGMANAPLPIGSRVELRLIHHFSMRDGLIAREQVFEIWRLLDKGLLDTGLLDETERAAPPHHSVAT
jgi:ketosteroid isomerase-like protein